MLKHAPGSHLTYKQATEQAKSELAAERLEITNRSKDAEKPVSEHVEAVV